MAATPLTISEGLAYIERSRTGQTLAEQAAEWSGSLRLFLERAWADALAIKDPFSPGWHIDAICDHLQAVTDGELRRLIITVPPGTTKSTITSICWPVWEWTRDPRRRHLTASYDQRLATRFSVRSRDMIRLPWFQSRWGDRFKIKADENLKTEYANDRGGRRLAISTSTGTGEHGDVIVIDDPHNAREILSDVQREGAIEWYDGTVRTRFTDPKEGAVVIIAQRLHERDLIGHLLAGERDDWQVLCLPEEYEPRHPLVTPTRVELGSGRELAGDPRTEAGELLCPQRIGPAEHVERLKMGPFKAAGQLQQRPAAREGAILKRDGWRFYPPQRRDEPDDMFVARLPRFTAIWQSWDTSFRDGSQNDLVAGTVWGQVGADLYLLPEGRHVRMNLSATKTAIRELYAWVEARWPTLPHRVLVEHTANGPDVIAELQRELRGITPTRPSVGADKPAVKKTIRAEAASPALESGNIHLPGTRDADAAEGYDTARTWGLAQELVEQCAAFPNAEHDDLVDSFTQAVNWTRRSGTRGKVRMSRPSGPLLARR